VLPLIAGRSLVLKHYALRALGATPSYPRCSAGRRLVGSRRGGDLYGAAPRRTVPISAARWGESWLVVCRSQSPSPTEVCSLITEEVCDGLAGTRCSRTLAFHRPAASGRRLGGAYPVYSASGFWKASLDVGCGAW